MTGMDRKIKPDDAFVAMINENKGIMRKICNIYAHTREDKQDMFQEIVLQLWKSYPNFRGECKASTWMYKIALNTALTGFKKSKRVPETRELDPELHDIADNCDKAFDEDDIRILYIAIGRLSEIEKAIIMLYLEENSYDEIAAITGITAKNVSVRLVRIKAKLETILSSLNK
jgi:RNA polymerase sigma-70 factor (ECF subfamily)